jgi:AcrR family transcriptional regulator
VSTPSTKQQRKRRPPGEARRLLLEAAHDVFTTKGYANASTREVAERAGVAEGLLFRHFGTKAQLFAEAVLEPFNGFVETFVTTWQAEHLEAQSTVEIEPLHRMYIESLYDTMVDNRDVILAVIAATAFDPEALESGPAFNLSDVLDKMNPIVEEEVPRLHLREFDALVNIRAVVGMVFSLAVLGPWFLPSDSRRPSRKRIVDEITKISMYGVSRPPGESV